MIYPEIDFYTKYLELSYSVDVVSTFLIGMVCLENFQEFGHSTNCCNFVAWDTIITNLYIICADVVHIRMKTFNKQRIEHHKEQSHE